MSNKELDKTLRQFYAEARTQTGQEYSRSSLLGFRNSIERHFIASNGRSLKLSGNPVFARSNKVLESKLKALCQEGKENVQHKAVIESQDLIKLSNSPFMSPKNPAGLLWKVRFYCTLYRCRRGSEGQNIHFARLSQIKLIHSRLPFVSCFFGNLYNLMFFEGSGTFEQFPTIHLLGILKNQSRKTTKEVRVSLG